MPTKIIPRELIKHLEYNPNKPKSLDTKPAIKHIDELIEYHGYKLPNTEHKAITELEELIVKSEPAISDKREYKNFEITINNNRITYLRLSNKNLTQIPEQINCPTNLKELDLGYNQIKEINNLDGLTNLQVLYLGSNQIKEINNLDSLTNLQVLHLGSNQIKEITNLDSLTNLQKLYFGYNPINNTKTNKAEIKKLKDRKVMINL